MLIYLSGMPQSLAISHSESLCTLSKAFLKTMKFICRGIWNSTLCSIIFLRMKICSGHKRPFRNPACSSRSISSVATLILFSKVAQNTLLGTDSSVTPFQLLQSLMFPFFGSLTINPFLHPSGTCSFVHQRLKRCKVSAIQNLSEMF